MEYNIEIIRNGVDYKISYNKNIIGNAIRIFNFFSETINFEFNLFDKLITLKYLEEYRFLFSNNCFVIDETGQKHKIYKSIRENFVTIGNDRLSLKYKLFGLDGLYINNSLFCKVIDSNFGVEVYSKKISFSELSLNLVWLILLLIAIEEFDVN